MMLPLQRNKQIERLISSLSFVLDLSRFNHEQIIGLQNSGFCSFFEGNFLPIMQENPSLCFALAFLMLSTVAVDDLNHFQGLFIDEYMVDACAYIFLEMLGAQVKFNISLHESFLLVNRIIQCRMANNPTLAIRQALADPWVHGILSRGLTNPRAYLNKTLAKFKVISRESMNSIENINDVMLNYPGILKMVYFSTVVCLGRIPIEELDIYDLLRRHDFKESLVDVFSVIEDITENRTDRYVEPCQELVTRSEEFIINNPVNVLSSNIENLFENDPDINLISTVNPVESTGINYRRVIAISALLACAGYLGFPFLTTSVLSVSAQVLVSESN